MELVSLNCRCVKLMNSSYCRHYACCDWMITHILGKNSHIVHFNLVCCRGYQSTVIILMWCHVNIVPIYMNDKKMIKEFTKQQPQQEDENF